MNLTFSLSLEQRTLANIAIILWTQDDVRNLMSKPALQLLNDSWQVIEKAVIEKSLKLRLPECFKKKLLNFIVRVGFQILSWVELHNCYYKFVTELPATFVWTSMGTINNVETAKLLIMGDTLDYECCFALACMYCLKNEIEYCWDIDENAWDGTKFRCHISTYWVNYMLECCGREDLPIVYLPKCTIPNTNFIVEAVNEGNEAAMKYFFNVNMNTYDYVKLTKVVASKLHNKTITDLQRYSSVMLFLMSKMNAAQQTDAIVNNTLAFLKCLLVWPWHSLFLEIVKDTWNSLSKKEYSDLLCSMASLMRYEPNLHKLFEEFWQQSPEAYKQFFIDDRDNILDLLIKLCKRGDEKNLKEVLKYSSISTKENILKIKPMFVCLVSSEKWNLIEFLIQECISSREDLIRFRNVFKEHVQKLPSQNGFCMGSYSNLIEEYGILDLDIIAEFEFIEEDQWNKFFQLVDAGIFRYKKRRHIEDNTWSKKCVKVLNNN